MPTPMPTGKMFAREDRAEASSRYLCDTLRHSGDRHFERAARRPVAPALLTGAAWAAPLMNERLEISG
ncbi:hypothetical protein [Burkholderia anthina]|uniref:hypothetical protein n=1 Tax=Burkholderia anthina TaxID=179879 RepID=UPI00158E543D|nr:hypothetical protein [Burkholderia anthina]